MMMPIPPRSLPFLRRSPAVCKRSPSSRKTAEGTRSRVIEAAVFSFFGLREPGPAGWLYTKWRAGVSSVLKLLRWVDTWAYLISVPFLDPDDPGNRRREQGVHSHRGGRVVLANYGRFWADLLAFFVRPYKDGPVHGLAFLFPPYMLYYLATRWDHMKKIVRRIATSCIPILLVVLMYGFLPSANPEAQNVQGFGAKLKAGKQELDKEIKSELKSLKKELIKLEKPQEDRPEALNLMPAGQGPRAEYDSASPTPDGTMEQEMHRSVILGVMENAACRWLRIRTRRVTRLNFEDLLALDRSCAVLLLLGRVGGFARSR